MSSSNCSPEPLFSLSISSTRFFRTLAVLLEALTFGTLWFACVFTVECLEFQPSVSYLWAISGLDRVAVVQGTVASVGLIPLFLGTLVLIRDRSTTCDSIMLGVFGLLISLLVGLISMYDSYQGIVFLPYPSYHNSLIYLLLVLATTWLLTVLWIAERVATEDYKSMKRWTTAVWGLVLVTVAEWQVGFSTYRNVLFNPLLFALCEWLTVALALLLPLKVSEAIGHFSIEFYFTQ